MIIQLQKHICNTISTLIIFCFFSFSIQLNGQNTSEKIDQELTSFVYQKLSTPNPTTEAKALFRFLQNMSGEKILSGQMSESWGINELDYIKNNTLKQPAILGFDFIDESDNNEIQNAINWWKKGGIPLLMWNWSELSKSKGFNKLNEVNLNRCFSEGTPENKAMLTELEKMADNLEKLKNADVPIIWSPFYKLNTNNFWWEKQGPELFKRMWITMFDYFVKERKLNNLIWVFGQNENHIKNWFPGNKYIDILGVGSLDQNSDSQDNIFETFDYASSSSLTPLALNYCRTIPDPDECLLNGEIWSWWMQWHTTYLEDIDKEFLRKVYTHKLVITLDEVPNIVQEYSNDFVKRKYNGVRTVPFSEFKSFKIGSKSKSDKVTINKTQIEIATSGDDIWGEKDNGYFVFKQFVGDFDFSVQVLDLSSAHLYTKAGIMARVDLSKKSKHVFFQVFPDNNKRNKNLGGCEFQYRPQKSKESYAIYPDKETAGNRFDVNFPNTWIRLKRNGDIFRSYISNDNENWMIYARHKQKMPENLLVGLAVTSHDANKKTIAKFSTVTETWDR